MGGGEGGGSEIGRDRGERMKLCENEEHTSACRTKCTISLPGRGLRGACLGGAGLGTDFLDSDIGLDFDFECRGGGGELCDQNPIASVVELLW